MYANIFGVTTSRIEVEYVTSKLMKQKYVEADEGQISKQTRIKISYQVFKSKQ